MRGIQSRTRLDGNKLMMDFKLYGVPHYMASETKLSRDGAHM